jgi:hypothetical protein
MRRLKTVTISKVLPGATVFTYSGKSAIVERLEGDRIVVRVSDGLKRIPIDVVARWELPPIPKALAVGDRTITTKPIETRQAHIIVGTRGVVLMPSHQAYGLIRVKLEDVEYPVDLSLDEIRLAL